MKTLYPPADVKARPLTYDEVVRVDAFSMGPADYNDQRHARYDPRRMRKLLERKLSEEKPHPVSAPLKWMRKLYD